MTRLKILLKQLEVGMGKTLMALKNRYVDKLNLSLIPKPIRDNFLFVVLLLVMAVQSFSLIYKVPLDFDGSYNLQIPVNIAKGLGYSTFVGPIKEFNYLITTGYPTLLPVAAMFKAFGVGIIQFRIVTLLFYLGFLTMLYVVTKKISNKWIALLPPTIYFFFSNLPNAKLPYQQVNPYSLVGEIPAAFFLLVGFYLIHISLNKEKNKYILYSLLAGLFIGFSALSKTLFLFALPSIAIVYFYDVFIKKNLKSVVSFLLLLAVVFLILFSWGAYKKQSIGPELYPKYAKQAAQQFYDSGSGLTEHGFTVSDSLLTSKKTNLALGMGVSTKLPLVIVALIASALFFRLYKDKITYLEIMISLFVAIYFFWWLGISDRAWYRHILPAVVVSLPLMSSLVIVVSDFAKTGKKILLNYIVALISVLIIVLAFSGMTVPTNNNLAAQINFSNKVKLLNRIIVYRGWWQNPEIAFLQQKSFIAYSDYVKSNNPEDPVIILSPVERALDNQGYTYRKNLCKDVLVIVDGYEACDIDINKAR